MNCPSVRWAWITLRPPISSTAASPSWGRKPITGLYFASSRVATIDWSNTRETLWRKRSQLVRLAREGLDDAHAGDVLLGVGRQLGDALLDLLDRRARAAPVALGDHDHERHRRHRDQRRARG